MVYKKYVYKRGRKHGPYYYHSYREGDKVKKIYIGGKKEYENWLKKQEQEKGISKADKSKSIETSRTTFSLPSLSNNQKKWLIAIPIIVIVLIFAAFFIYNYSVTGRITLDTQDSYLDGENISGTLRLGLKNGELLPINSKLIINSDGIEREISLAEILEPNSEGNFYVEGKQIDGFGKGYGFSGEKITYPEVFFKLKVHDSSEEEPQDEETSAVGGVIEGTPIEIPEEVAEEQVEQQPTEETAEEIVEESIEEHVQETETTKQDVSKEQKTEEKESEKEEKQAGKETKQTSQESESQAESTPISETSESASETVTESAQEAQESAPEAFQEAPETSPITGEATKEQEKVKYVDGKCKKDGPFLYSLEEGKTATIKPESVKAEIEENNKKKEKKISDSSVTLQISGQQVQVTTDYAETEEGFGQDYLENEENYIEISLDELDIEAKQGILTIRLVYQDTELAETSKEISVEQPEINETVPVVPNITEIENVTEIENITIVNETLINITEQNITLANETTANITEVNITIANETLLNETLANETLVNETITNLTALNITTKKAKIIIGRPVKWVKTVRIEPETTDLTLELPKQAENITIKTGQEARDAEQEIDNYEILVEQSDRQEIVSGGLTGMVSLDIQAKQGILTKLWNFIRKLTITGNVISEQETQDSITETDDNKIVDITEIAQTTGEQDIAVEYYTPSPEAIEENISGGKRVIISADDEFEYTNILTYTLLDENIYGNISINSSGIKLIWHASYEDALRYGYIQINQSEENVPKIEEINETSELSETNEIINEEVVNETQQETQTEEIINETENILVNETIIIENETENNQIEEQNSSQEIQQEISLITGEVISEEVNNITAVQEEANLTTNETLITKQNQTEKTYLIEISYDAYDLNNDSYIDYIEWNVEHLSTQTYTIVISSKIGATTNIIKDGNYYHLSPSTTAPYDSLVGYWNFDGDNIKTEDLWTTGQVGNAGYFDGYGDYIGFTVGATPSELNFSTTDFSLSLWFKYTDNSIENLQFYDGRSGATNIGFELRHNVGGDLEWLIDWGDTTSTGRTWTSLAVEEWHHAVLTVNRSGDAYISVDGVKIAGSVGDISANAGVDIYAAQACLGGCSATTTFNGSIDEVKFWNRTLSATEILDLYNNESQGYNQADLNTTDLVAEWKLNETSGIIASDSAGANTGTWTFTKPSYDFTSNNNDGTSQGNTVTNTTGCLYDDCLQLDGTGDCVNLGDVLDMADGENRTFSFWMKGTTSGSYALSGLITKQVGGASWSIELGGTSYSGRIRLMTINSTVGSNANVYSNAGTNLGDNQWHHIVGIIERKTNGQVLYVDNVLQTSTGTPPSNAYSNAFSSWIGCDGVPRYFNGSIDEVMIFNTSLNSSQILDIYNNQSSRFVSSGTLDVNQTNITSGYDTVNITSVLENNLGSNVSLILGYYDGGWSYTASQNLTASNIYTITSITTNLTFNFTLLPDSYAFYTPLLNDSMINIATSESINAPLVSITYPSNNTNFNTTSVALNYSASDINLDSCWYSINDGENNSLTDCANTTMTLNEGYNNITVYANDSFNQIGIASVFSVYADTIFPTLNLTSPLNTSWFNSSSVLINVSSSEAGTGMIVPDLDSSLVSWWRMDDVNQTSVGAKVYDYLGINNGTAVDNAAQTQAGKFGKGFVFDGNGDYVLAGYVGILGNNSWSTSSWIKFDSVTSPSIQNILSFGASVSYNISTQVLFQQKLQCGGGYYAVNAWVPTIDTVNAGKWYNLICIYNGTAMNNYLDGVYQGNKVYQLDITDAHPLRIGRPIANTQYFNGSIDEVLIFNRSLSASEISALYNATKLQYTQTGLADGSHTYKAYTQDLAANIVSSGLNGFGVDTIFPTINFTGQTPANGTTQASNSIYVNITSNDTNQHFVVNNFDNSLISWWRMDDINSSGDVVDYLGVNNGSKVDNAAQTDAGKFGKGFSFDGAGDYVNAGTSLLSGSGTTNLTISAWVYLNSYKDYAGIVTKTNSGAESLGTFSFRFASGANNGKPIFYVFNETTKLSSGVGSVVPLKTWTHLVAVYNGTNSVIYKDSVVDIFASGLYGGANLSSQKVLIGALSTENYYLNGSIDEVMFFNRSLSASEISALYNATANKYYNNFTSLADGSHTITGYAVDAGGNLNETETRSVTVETGTDVTICRDLTQANSVYTLQNDISTTSTCFTVLANNITLDFAGYNITGDEGSSDSGVYASGYNSTTIKNGFIYDFGYGIYLLKNQNNTLTNITSNSNYNFGVYLSSSSNNTISTITSNSNDYYGIYLVSSSNNNLTGITANSNGDAGISLESSSNNTLTDITANLNVNNYGIYLSSSSDNNLTDITVNENFEGIYIAVGSNNIFTGFVASSNSDAGILINSGSNNIFQNGVITTGGGSYASYLISSSINNTFLNASYDSSTEYVEAGSELIRKWYYRAYVNDTAGNLVSGANVTAYNVTGTYNFNLTTNSSGWTEIENIIDYINTGTRSYYSLYTIYAKNDSYDYLASKTYNATSNENNLKDVFTTTRKPVVTLTSPENGNITTNRTPEFSWSGSDPESDSLTYEINISCLYVGGGTCHAGDDYQSLGAATSYIPSSYMEYLIDNSYYYNWSVRAYDGLMYSDWATERNISIQASVTISLPTSEVNFGQMNITDTENTSDDSPAPLILRNDGNAELNISVNFTDLFSSASNPSIYFQYKIRNNSLGCYVDTGTQTPWAQAPSITTNAINRLNFTSGYQTGCNNVSVDLYVSVPPNEPGGNKSSIITFTSSLGEPGFGAD